MEEELGDRPDFDSMTRIELASYLYNNNVVDSIVELEHWDRVDLLEMCRDYYNL